MNADTGKFSTQAKIEPTRKYTHTHTHTHTHTCTRTRTDVYTHTDRAERQAVTLPWAGQQTLRETGALKLFFPPANREVNRGARVCVS